MSLLITVLLKRICILTEKPLETLVLPHVAASSDTPLSLYSRKEGCANNKKFSLEPFKR